MKKLSQKLRAVHCGEDIADEPGGGRSGAERRRELEEELENIFSAEWPASLPGLPKREWHYSKLSDSSYSKLSD